MSKKKMTGREVLEEALRGCCSTYCDQYPRYEGKIDLGDDYEKYMHNLIKRSKNPIQRYFNTIGRRVAGIAAAMLIAFGCSMTVKAVREPVVEFFANIYDTFLEIRFGKDDIEKAPVTIETVYTLGFIPDGYMVDRFFIGRDTTNMTWKNENGDRLVLCDNINEYLLPMENIWLKKTSKPKTKRPEMVKGCYPTDGGNYIFTPEEKSEFIKKEPGSEKYFRRWIGSEDMLNGKERYILFLKECRARFLCSFRQFRIF